MWGSWGGELKGILKKANNSTVPLGDHPLHRGLLTEFGDLSSDGAQRCPLGKWPVCPHLLVVEEGGGLQALGLGTESSTTVSPSQCDSVTWKKGSHSHNQALELEAS